MLPGTQTPPHTSVQTSSRPSMYSCSTVPDAVFVYGKILPRSRDAADVESATRTCPDVIGDVTPRIYAGIGPHCGTLSDIGCLYGSSGLVSVTGACGFREQINRSPWYEPYTEVNGSSGDGYGARRRRRRRRRRTAFRTDSTLHVHGQHRAHACARAAGALYERHRQKYLHVRRIDACQRTRQPTSLRCIAERFSMWRACDQSGASAGSRARDEAPALRDIASGRKLQD
jgi:hypothetical protein